MKKKLTTLLTCILFVAFPIGGMASVEGGNTPLVMLCSLGFIWIVCVICFDSGY